MLNWADLSALMIILAGVIGGLAGAREGNAGVVVTFLFCLTGFVMGYILARVSRLLAYSVLMSRRLPVGVALALYMAVPMFFLMLTMGGTVFLSIWLAKQVL